MCRNGIRSNSSGVLAIARQLQHGSSSSFQSTASAKRSFHASFVGNLWRSSLQHHHRHHHAAKHFSKVFNSSRPTSATTLWTHLGTLTLVSRIHSWRRDRFVLSTFIFPTAWADGSLAVARPNLASGQQLTQKQQPISLIHEIWQLIRRDWPLLLAVILSTVAGALASLALPRVMGQLVTVISQSLTTASPTAAATAATTTGTSLAAALAPLNRPALRLLALFLAKGILTFTHISLVSQLGENLAHRLRTQLFDSLVHQDLAFFDARQSSELVARLTADVQEFKHTFKQCVTNGLRSVTEVTGSVLHLLHLSPVLTATLAGSMPVLYLIGTLYGAYLRRLSRKAKDVEASALGSAGEALGNIRSVKAYAAEDREVAKLHRATRKSAAWNQYLGMHIGAFQAITSTSIGSMILLVLYVGGAQVAQGAMDPGHLMTYLMATQAAQRSLAQLGVLVGQLIKAQAAAVRVFEFIHMQPEIPVAAPGQAVRLSDLRGELEFSHVDFAYPTRPDHVVLRNFSLHVPAGSVVALCGASGSGKTTVSGLLERFYDPLKGQVTVDGVDLRDMDTKWWREHVGYLAQQPVLFSSTIKDNIKYGRPDATDEEVEQAARAANAHEFISGFADGYETVVGERGASLSGGQRQRIAIAAAILKNPKILILDEATSALDTQSERLVQDALNKLMHGRTVIVIAHRLQTIQNADMIVVMGKPQGQILEMGTHAQLMAMKGTYWKMHTVGTAGILD
ncbi:P-loop containing nucleoside triphosphate hydrolase protein [Catenaria anguillulae PL171]|uniref:Mitochondrial potassium channel ATP-binding subunit n=1 Tax=Catenaria anguillulae PL171 TaxID=765915 RepID=A0A1Y2I4J2_9FUNG|nr:P-loop containing nucleoside triphosphate hydrolase protein [Catenaria anguillulae PL171]